jgi:phosphate-selective porin OprO/OprP
VNPHWKTPARQIFAGLISAFLIASTTGGLADDLSSEVIILRKKIEELDRKVRTLERKNEISEEEVTRKFKETSILSVGENGISFTSADKNTELKLRGLYQWDTRVFESPSNPTDDGFLLRRARPIFSGTFFKNYEFVIQPDFGPVTTGGSVTVQDAFLNVNYWKEFQVKVGRSKGPFGIERSQSSAVTAFPEAGLPQNLTPNYDQAVLLTGNIRDGWFQYAVGISNGASDNSNGDGLIDDEFEFVGSVFTHPFRATDLRALKNLGFGVAGTYGHRSGAGPGNYVTPGQQGTVLTYRDAPTGGAAAWVEGTAYRISPSAYYYHGPFGLLGEYIVSDYTVARAATGATPCRSSPLENTSWQVIGSWALTGEDESYAGLVPKSPFKFGQSLGAWELVARYGELNVDPRALTPSIGYGANNAAFATGTQKNRSFGIGLNWHLSRNLKVQLSYDHTDFSGLDTRTTDFSDESVIITRLQLAF